MWLASWQATDSGATPAVGRYPISTPSSGIRMAMESPSRSSVSASIDIRKPNAFTRSSATSCAPAIALDSLISAILPHLLWNPAPVEWGDIQVPAGGMGRFDVEHITGGVSGDPVAVAAKRRMQVVVFDVPLRAFRRRAVDVYRPVITSRNVSWAVDEPRPTDDSDGVTVVGRSRVDRQLAPARGDHIVPAIRNTLRTCRTRLDDTGREDPENQRTGSNEPTAPCHAEPHTSYFDHIEISVRRVVRRDMPENGSPRFSDTHDGCRKA